MPRTKGAKNIPKSLQYHLDKVKELGGDVPAVKKVKKVAETVENVKQVFTIDKPKTDEPENEPENPPVNPDSDVIRCGNPECNKILQSEVSTCPHCGVKLTWQ